MKDYSPCSFSAIELYLQDVGWKVSRQKIYRYLRDLEVKQLIQSEKKEKGSPLNVYSITSTGIQACRELIKILFGKKQELIQNQSPRHPPPLEEELIDSITEILSGIFYDDPPTDLQIQRVAAGTKRIVKFFKSYI